MTDLIPGLASGMAGIAGLAVIRVAADIFMVRIRRAFIMGMAVDTGKLAIIRGQVAIRTFESGMSSGLDRKIVVEDSL